MSEFDLKILTPDQVIMDQKVEKIVVRTTEGDVGILKGHVNYLAAIKEGYITVFFVDGNKEKASLKEGFVCVINGKVNIIVLNYNKVID